MFFGDFVLVDKANSFFESNLIYFAGSRMNFKLWTCFVIGRRFRASDWEIIMNLDWLLIKRILNERFYDYGPYTISICETTAESLASFDFIKIAVKMTVERRNSLLINPLNSM